MTLTAQQRTIVGLVRGGGAHLHEEGWKVWRHPQAGEWQASTEEITAHLDALEVPYTVSIVRRRQSSRSAVSVAGLELRVATSDLPALLRWVPSLQRQIDALEADRR
ncbi:MAG TPA: hypothetical protein VFD59_04490 [Nocardioidaceae bacterium]|nr:hypothetical protein [Nocardioidaceae bacterium]